MTKPLLLLTIFLAASCGTATDPVSGNGTGPGTTLCPDSQNAAALANNLPLPYPNNPASSEFPSYYHPCLRADGSQSYSGTLPCFVCGNLYDQTAILSWAPDYGACVQDTARSPNPPAYDTVMCVKPLDPANLATCDPGSQGCI